MLAICHEPSYQGMPPSQASQACCLLKIHYNLHCRSPFTGISFYLVLFYLNGWPFEISWRNKAAKYPIWLLFQRELVTWFFKCLTILKCSIFLILSGKENNTLKEKYIMVAHTWQQKMTILTLKMLTCIAILALWLQKNCTERILLQVLYFKE